MVLSTFDPSIFRVIMVEWGSDERINQQVHELLVAARMRLHREWKVRYIFEGSRSRVYVSRGWPGRPGVMGGAAHTAGPG